jgi:hypothetical protein
MHTVLPLANVVACIGNALSDLLQTYFLCIFLHKLLHEHLHGVLQFISASLPFFSSLAASSPLLPFFPSPYSLTPLFLSPGEKKSWRLQQLASHRLDSHVPHH